MGKIFSVLSWNVKHFGDGSRDSKGKLKPEFKAKVGRITEMIVSKDPDIFALYEVKGQDVFFELMNHFEGYSFHITEGPQTQEILVGIKSDVTAFVTQRLEFKANNPNLRPGLFVTISRNEKRYSLLFLHLKSMPDPYGWGMRDLMWDKMRSLKKALNGMAGGAEKAHFIVMGDLNTMGMNLTFSQKDFAGDEELKRFDEMVKAPSYGLKRLSKTHDLTYRTESGTLKSDLDHVYASNHLRFAQHEGSEVKVIGWPEKQTEEDTKEWIQNYSDHAMLYFEIEE
ncbi:MAG: endonuclease/exonuclease/phosphatase family protein [Cyclobacteriaceae bacterium]